MCKYKVCKHCISHLFTACYSEHLLLYRGLRATATNFYILKRLVYAEKLFLTLIVIIVRTCFG